MVQTLRARASDVKRRAFLDEAARLVDQDGLDALTIKALAERVGCSVGALYRHFDSKDALIVAMQAEAIQTLLDAYDNARPALGELLENLSPEQAALGQLIGFGAMVAAASEVFPYEFGLQQRLLSSQLAMDPSQAAAVIPIATAMMLRPAELIDTAQAHGWLRPGPAFERAVRWVAALGGVLQLHHVRHPDAPTFDVQQLANDLTTDLLSGWGAEPVALVEASDVVGTAVVREVLAAPSGGPG